MVLAASLFVATGGLAAVAHCRGELVYFRKSGEAQLPAAIDGNRITLMLPDRKVELVRADFKKIVPGYWPEVEWKTRRDRARAAGSESRFAAVWWAIENGLTTEAVAEIRAFHIEDSRNLPVARMAERIERLDRPCGDPEFARFQKSLGIETKVARGPHVILLHQHSDANVEERIALLEQVLTGFHLMFAAQGVELAVPRKRLVSAWFADQKDYLAFLRTEDATAFATTRGYFHPTWNAVVAYDARSGDDQKTARDKLAAKRDEVNRYQEMVARAPARSRIKMKVADERVRTVSPSEARALLARIDADITSETVLLDLDQRAIDLGTAAHEMIHQLSTDSGLVAEHDLFPVWLHEGLAAQFEVIRGGRWAGISRAHDLRLPDWRRLERPLPLERLVRDAGFGRGYNRDLYAQAWALVYFLRTQHSAQFLTFIDLIRTRTVAPDGAAPASADRVSEAFRRAFGTDLVRLEGQWRAFMTTVQTPLEQQAPRASR